jgi:hypothetical protein
MTKVDQAFSTKLHGKMIYEKKPDTVPLNYQKLMLRLFHYNVKMGPGKIL